VLKRMFLFVLTNIAVMVMVSIVLAVLGQLGVLDMAGAQGTLLVYCAIWGFGAAFVSLLLSRWMAKRAMGVKLVSPDTRDPEAQWLYNTVARLTQQANLPMPEVGIYESPELNAFATGPSKRKSLVAVSSGLLRRMERQEVEGVLAHVVAAIARNFLGGRDDEGRPGVLGFFAGQIVFIAAQIVFGLLGSMITAWFSRHREFRADAGGASLAGRGSMVAALKRLAQAQGVVDNRGPELATFKIAGRSRMMMLLSTHPPLEQRIAALEGRA